MVNFRNIENVVKTEDMYIISDEGLIYKIAEGTGDNLNEDDTEAGYVDYIMYDVYDTLKDLAEGESSDGGQILLKTLYKDLSYADVLRIVSEFTGSSFYGG